MAAIVLGLLVSSCSSTGVMGRGGPHSPTPADMAGDYSAFLRHNGTEAAFHTLVGQLESVAPFGQLGDKIDSGVLVIALPSGASAALSNRVLSILRASPVVDHVEMGGCDKRPTACDQWSSTADAST